MADWASAGGSILGAGLGFLGGIMGNAQQNQQWNAANRLAQQQMAFQREAATMGIRWRVADAKAAGVSPLVALGAPTFNPGAIGVPLGGGSNPFENAGRDLGRVGQDVASAIGRSLTEKEKIEVANQQTALANNTRLTDAHVANLNAQANYYNSRAFQTPNFPSSVNDQGYLVSGQGDSGTRAGHTASPAVGGYVNKPPDLATHQPGNPGVVSGRGSPADQAYWTKEGLLEFQPAAGTPASQGDVFNSGMNWLRNRIAPAFQGDSTFNNPTIFKLIKDRYPAAVGYKSTGAGYYRPVFPEEQVREDVFRARRSGSY